LAATQSRYRVKDYLIYQAENCAARSLTWVHWTPLPHLKKAGARHCRTPALGLALLEEH